MQGATVNSIFVYFQKKKPSGDQHVDQWRR